MQAVYRYWAGLVFLLVVVQVGLAGYGAFYVADAVDKNPINQHKFDHGFGVHAGFGYLVVLSGLLFLLIAFAARVGKQRLIRNGVLFGLLVLQLILAWIAYAVSALGFLHPINALLIFGLSGSIAWNEWRGTAPAAATAI